MMHKLFTPGPVPLPRHVTDALAKDPLYHRSNEFKELSATLWSNLRTLFGNSARVVTLAGTGTTGLEACVASSTRAGTRVAVLSNGRFGQRLAVINRLYGAEVHEYQIEWGKPLTSEHIDDVCSTFKDFDIFWCVHSETSTGVCNPVREITQRVRKNCPDALIMVDVVTSLAVEELDVRSWDIDAAVAGIQKGLMCPPGLACVHISERFEEKLLAQPPCYTLNLRASIDAQNTGIFPWTPPVTLVAALAASAEHILRLGLPAVWHHHELLARYTRAALEQRGFLMFGDASANGVVVAQHPHASEFCSRLRATGFMVASGQEQLAGKVVRIGTCGSYTTAMIDELLHAIDAIESTK